MNYYKFDLKEYRVSRLVIQPGDEVLHSTDPNHAIVALPLLEAIVGRIAEAIGATDAASFQAFMAGMTDVDTAIGSLGFAFDDVDLIE